MTQRIMSYCHYCRKLRVFAVTETDDGRDGVCEGCGQQMAV
jgi:hypothetical protein